jgi:Na+/H+-dicarboxylate symporter
MFRFLPQDLRARPARTLLGAWSRLAASPWVVCLSIGAGVATGQAAPGLARRVGAVGDLYISLLEMVVLPFMVAAVVFSLRRLLGDRHSLGDLRLIPLAFTGFILAAALVGTLAALLLGPGRDLPPDTLLAMARLAGGRGLPGSHDTLALFAQGAATAAPGLGERLLELVPSNVFAALARGDALKVMAFALLFGLAAGRCPDRGEARFTNMLETVYQACLALTHGFNQLLPLALYSIIASQVARTGLQPLRAMAGFLLALAAAGLALVLLSLATLQWASRRPWTAVLRSQRVPMLMALATRNTRACMPSMIDSLDSGLGLPRERVELLVPLGASLLRSGQAFYYALVTVFLAQLYGVHLGPQQLAMTLAGSVLLGFASTGLSGVLVVSSAGVLCGALGVPFEGALALFIAVDPVCDILRTVVGVVSNDGFTAVASGRAPAAGG